MLKCKIGNCGSKCIFETVVMIESKKLNCVNCANKIKNKNNIDNSRHAMIIYTSCRVRQVWKALWLMNDNKLE